ncbi:GMC oxidoreductase [Ruegeria arenilitoris]|uniref:GMC oxidoreductase n=1 Tax=Ruegeria arenilitoris TaxID=1173585 RepID=UPI00147B5911|nr:GMC family oxidoreductase [Ruegeria arenilitoris]
MEIIQLQEVPHDQVIRTDVLIVGGGACGLTIARELIGSGLNVVVAESGLQQETPEHSALNTVDMPDAVRSQARANFNSGLATHWDQDSQPFGVRCRGLGGSTLAWAGKSAAFSEIDYQQREWVTGSGWPISQRELAPFIERAGQILNLGPQVYDSALWELLGTTPAQPSIDPTIFEDCFWQFSRSRENPLDLLRMGSEFANLTAKNVRVLLNATATKINVDTTGTRFESVSFATLSPEIRNVTIHAERCVLSAGAIENARLLLVSNDVHPNGLGNRFDLVGRYLCDHLQAELGYFDTSDAQRMTQRFGFFGLPAGGRTHMYSSGLATSPAIQRTERLLNGAIFFLEERSQEDPVSALGRLLGGKSQSRLQDVMFVARSPVFALKAAGMKALSSGKLPKSVRNQITEAAAALFPNSSVREFRYRGLPHKLDGIVAHAIIEQAPNPENRVVLSDRQDQLGQHLPKVNWSTGFEERHTLLQMGKNFVSEFKKCGLPPPQTSDWLRNGKPDQADMFDVGHTMGTTRMSLSPKEGVVTPDLRIRDIDGLYAAGGSVMPTTGHANPTLMMMSLSIRLADHLKQKGAS